MKRKRRKGKKTKKGNDLIDPLRTFCHCRFYPASLLRSGAIWGLFYWLSDITSQLLQETHSHHDLVGQEFTPISKEQNKQTNKKKKQSHHTRYGHTNERTTIQIFMKCFPNVNTYALTKFRNNNINNKKAFIVVVFIFMDLYRTSPPFTYRNTTTDENTLDSTDRGNLESSNSNPASKTNKQNPN